MKRIFLLVIVSSVIFTDSVLCQASSPGNNERASQYARIEAFKDSLLNKPMASLRLTDLDNTIWSTEKLKGKIVVINFWFTACRPCIQEMPHLNKLVAATDSTIVFLAPAPENQAQIKKFLKKFRFDYHIIPSSLDYITMMNIENFPTHLVIDKEGIIRYVWIGYSNEIKSKLEQEINKLRGN